MSHTHFCLLQALHHHTAVQLVSNHGASFLSELIHVSSIVQVIGNSFQTLCRLMSSLLCGSHHSSVSHCKNTSTGVKKIVDSIWKEMNSSTWLNWMAYLLYESSNFTSSYQEFLSNYHLWWKYSCKDSHWRELILLYIWRYKNFNSNKKEPTQKICD